MCVLFISTILLYVVHQHVCIVGLNVIFFVPIRLIFYISITKLPHSKSSFQLPRL